MNVHFLFLCFQVVGKTVVMVMFVLLEGKMREKVYFNSAIKECGVLSVIKILTTLITMTLHFYKMMKMPM